ncbi:MAG: LamG-like jellyroll fold domain-containing protein [Ferruginibacter sp.]
MPQQKEIDFCRLFVLSCTVILVTMYGSAIKAQDITAGLVGNYTFCDCSATDYSGNGRHGVVVGTPQCIRGILDYGFLFNQKPIVNACGQLGGEYVALPTIDAIWSGGFTVAAWVRFDEIKSFERIIDFSNSNGESGGLPIWFGREGNSNNLTLENWKDANGAQARSTGRLVAVNAITNGSIEYYCATLSSDTMRIYVNGALVAQKLGNAMANVKRTNNYIGRSAWCDPDFKGFMDEVRIYNRPLSGDEIASLYKITNLTDFNVQYTCAPTLVNFNVNNSTRADSVKWDFGDGPSGSFNTAPGVSVTHRFSDTGIFNVRVIGYKSCLNDTVIKQVRIDSYNNFLGADVRLCKGAKTASVNYTGATYLWQDGSTGNSFVIKQPGTYTLQVTHNGCLYDDTLIVNTDQKFSTSNLTICEGQNYDGHTAAGVYTDTLTTQMACDSIRTITLAVLPRKTFTQDVNICDGQTYMGYSKTGTYTDTLIAMNGCDSIRMVHLQVETAPVANLGIDTTICSGDMLKLTPGVFSTYLWQDGTTGTSLTAMHRGMYSVTVTNRCGTTTDAITIREEICNIYFPNAFTPNDDGKNEVFKILKAYNVENYYLVIFNRWGQKVFETNDYRQGWNGSFRSVPQAPGIFTWICNYKIKNKPVSFQKGTVYLMR